MITGTSNFYDKEGAVFYYRAYGFSESDVKGKIARGEICIGRPIAKDGERVFLNTKEMRYFIETRG